jgi:hypothetical protein
VTGPHGGGAVMSRHSATDQICTRPIKPTDADQVSSVARHDRAGCPTYKINRNWSPKKEQLMKSGRQHVGQFSGAPFIFEHLSQDQIRAPFLEGVIFVL